MCGAPYCGTLTFFVFKFRNSSSKTLLGTVIFSIHWNDIIAIRPVVQTGREFAANRTQEKSSGGSDGGSDGSTRNAGGTSDDASGDTRRKDTTVSVVNVDAGVGKLNERAEEKESKTEENGEEDDSQEDETTLRYAFLLFLRSPAAPPALPALPAASPASPALPASPHPATANSSSTTPSTFGTDSSNVLCMNGTRSLEIFLTAKQLYLWITLFREMHLRMFFYFTFSIESAHNC